MNPGPTTTTTTSLMNVIAIVDVSYLMLLPLLKYKINMMELYIYTIFMTTLLNNNLTTTKNYVRYILLCNYVVSCRVYEDVLVMKQSMVHLYNVTNVNRDQLSIDVMKIRRLDDVFLIHILYLQKRKYFI